MSRGIKDSQGKLSRDPGVGLRQRNLVGQLNVDLNSHLSSGICEIVLSCQRSSRSALLTKFGSEMRENLWKMALWRKHFELRS